MSMMMPPEAPPGLPVPPGGGEMGLPPRDVLNQTPMPGEDGIAGLLAALGGGGGEAPAGDMTEGGLAPEESEELDTIGHIQQAMKHLMMAFAMEGDEERGVGITKNMAGLQAILGGEQKKNAQMQALGG